MSEKLSSLFDSPMSIFAISLYLSPSVPPLVPEEGDKGFLSTKAAGDSLPEIREKKKLGQFM